MKNVRLLLASCLALVLVGGCAPAQKPAAPTARPARWTVSPVEAHGRLRVCGPKICSQAGQPVQLRGVSLFWSNTGWEGARFYDPRVLDTLGNDWNASVVRAAIGVQNDGGYLADPAANEARARVVIDAAIARGMYVIVDWHSHALLQKEAEAFFAKLARAYAAAPNLIWETFNEPMRHDWLEELKPYHEAVIAAIRKAGSKNLVVVGTPMWSQDVDTAALEPIETDRNVAYTLHFYAGTHRQSLRDKAAFAMKLGAALFVTEWGTCDSSGDRNFDPAESKRWTDFMDANAISSLNWSIADKNETASALRPGAPVGGWTDADLTESGRLVKAYVEAGYR
ncbi:MAG TPA: glycoside hydrolase family 5 protein [Anaeromyxobacter sp.]|nr:glycoside hydrolase family 5 protein [Anaeromyxobacter sp.]